MLPPISTQIITAIGCGSGAVGDINKNARLGVEDNAEGKHRLHWGQIQIMSEMSCFYSISA